MGVYWDHTARDPLPERVAQVARDPAVARIDADEVADIE